MADVAKVSKQVVIGDPGQAASKIVKYIVVDLNQPTVAPTPPNRKVQVTVRIGER